MLMPIAASAQHEHQDSSPATAKPAQTPTEAQKSFALLKTFAGTWEASITAPDEPAKSPAQPPTEGTLNEVTIRVTSRGNAIVHELRDVSKADDPAHFDHPLTMLYMSGDQLQLTHYCDAGNRPHMLARTSPDGKTVEFEMVDIVGPLKNGHMVRAAFTAVDANHHTEDWTWAFPDNKAVRYHFDLHRKGGDQGSSDK